MNLPALDISRFPAEYRYGPVGNQINLAEIASNERSAIAGLIGWQSSFGFVMADPTKSPYTTEDPYNLIGFFVGWGSEYRVFEAACMMRPVVRTGFSTLELCKNQPGLFRGIVVPNFQERDSYWGDFPFSGGVLVNFEGKQLIGAASTFPLNHELNHRIARRLLYLIGRAMHQADNGAA